MKETWTLYKSTGKKEYRDQLILGYEPLVRMIATKMSQSFPSNVEVEDLISYGLGGLIDAIEKFDPSLGFKFETYANSRIRGAIIDDMRALDWVPRSVRSHDKEHGGTSGVIVGLDQPVRIDMTSSDGTDITLADTIYADEWDNDLVTMLAERTAEAADNLTERERLVVVLYYYDGLTMAEIGTIFGVTESRICQIHTRAISRLKDSYQ